MVLLAAFIPLLGGTGGNVGAQSSTVVIRGLSTQSISSLGPLRAIGREAMAGALLGVLMMLSWFLRLVARGERFGGPLGGDESAGDHTWRPRRVQRFRCCLTAWVWIRP